MARPLLPALALRQAAEYHARGQLAEAERGYRAVLAMDARNFEALHLLGVVRAQQGRHDEAIALIGSALRRNRKSGEAHYSLATSLQAVGRRSEAIASFRRALALKPDFADAHYHLANALRLTGRGEEAVASYGKALRLKPGHAEAHGNLGAALEALARPEEAVASYRQATLLRPDFAEAHYSLGNALAGLGRHEEAVASYGKALEQRPHFVEAQNNLGNALKQLARFEEAIACYRRAAEMAPGDPHAHANLGTLLKDLKRYDEAIACFERALACEPGNGYARGLLVWLLQECCRWEGLEAEEERLLAAARGNGKVPGPFELLAVASTPEEQLHCAREFLRATMATPHSPLRPARAARHDRLRLAYLSADFGEHPVSHLTAGLFEAHDRQRFEIYAVSFGPDRRDAMRERLARAFDRFTDVSAMSDDAAAREVARLEIDIAVDLMGHTRHNRMGIFARRPAPVQVSYLGYPGTAGASFMDYILADPFLVPFDQQPFFSERIVHLPDSFQANDPKRAISERAPTRAECGLPEVGFVFACFNASFKVTPAVFAIWMRLLASVPGSVLWLGAGNPWAEANLRRAAAAQGIAPERLVFAPRLPRMADHLARQRLADLFLDTFPYNAHATASDALWAGLPLVTRAGASCASRVAGSLLCALGLPELVTATPEAYEALALALAREPARLAGVRAALARNRLAAPLFDGERFRRNLEAAYAEMWRIREAGEAPRAFALPG